MQSDRQMTNQGLLKFVPDASNVALIFNQLLCQFQVELALVAALAGETPGENSCSYLRRPAKGSESVLCNWPCRSISS